MNPKQSIYIRLFYATERKKVLFQILEEQHFTLSNNNKIQVPKLYITDFATVPQWARSVINVVDKHYQAAILHDWLYDNQYQNNRKLADDEFLHKMKQDGVKKWKRNIMWFAVRIGGKKRWNDNTGGLH